MKKLFTFSLLFFICNLSFAQVAINTSNAVAHPSSILDVSSTEKGFLVPRMSTTQRIAIKNPANGLLVFDSTINSFWYYSGTWGELSSVNSNLWNKNGNNIITTNTGNVGIGASSPAQKLDVSGSIKGNAYVFPAPGNDFTPVITARVVPTGQGGGTEISELILFHGNDNANGYGPDLITMRAPSLRLQTYNDAAITDINNNAGSNDRIAITPEGYIDIALSQDVSKGSVGIGDGARDNAKLYVVSNMEYGFASFNPGKSAGLFNGNVSVTGTLSKGAGSFKIDHPLDPENKFLYHSFVESPDMMNVYNGNIITSSDGIATVELPSYFEALNKDFRYQLTVLGEFAQAIVFKKITNNSFQIKTDKPNIEVSWQVTGIRNDAFAQKHRIPVEENKKPEEKGKYLHPDAFGKTEDNSILNFSKKDRSEANK